MGSKEHQAGIVKLLTVYLTAFPQSKMDDAALVIYAKALCSLSLDQLNAAMLKLMRISKFFPTVAEIFEQVDNIQKFIKKAEVPTADAAWEEAMKLAHNKFLYAKWEYSCKEVELAIKRFGKTELCVLVPEAVNTARAQFMRIYDSIVKQQKNKIINESVVNSLPAKSLQNIIGSIAAKKSLTSTKKGE